jgi:membrane-bound lytic murein transglycosylase MltF
MQIKPSTAEGAPIRIKDVHSSAERNIHAGVRYLRFMSDEYFDEPGITPLDRHLFAIAAYNCGPARVRTMRRKASARGLDPNVWFQNVELISAREIGHENVDYVRNILKYWVAYRMASGRDPVAAAADSAP